MSMNKQTPPLNADLAAWWVARLDAPDCGASERAAFEDWLAQSSEQERAAGPGAGMRRVMAVIGPASLAHQPLLQ